MVVTSVSEVAINMPRFQCKVSLVFAFSQQILLKPPKKKFPENSSTGNWNIPRLRPDGKRERRRDGQAERRGEVSSRFAGARKVHTATPICGQGVTGLCKGFIWTWDKIGFILIGHPSISQFIFSKNEEVAQNNLKHEQHCN